jgi:hypothetical protein
MPRKHSGLDIWPDASDLAITRGAMQGLFNTSLPPETQRRLEAFRAKGAPKAPREIKFIVAPTGTGEL